MKTSSSLKRGFRVELRSGVVAPCRRFEAVILHRGRHPRPLISAMALAAARTSAACRVFTGRESSPRAGARRSRRLAALLMCAHQVSLTIPQTPADTQDVCQAGVHKTRKREMCGKVVLREVRGLRGRNRDVVGGVWALRSRPCSGPRWAWQAVCFRRRSLVDCIRAHSDTFGGAVCLSACSVVGESAGGGESRVPFHMARPFRQAISSNGKMQARGHWHLRCEAQPACRRRRRVCGDALGRLR